jgi:phosphoenolpyruvate synthase/pyruvate phosphate dikinase
MRLIASFRICVEAPANYPGISRFLTEIAVNSVSVNPASLMRTIAKWERKRVS